MGEGNNQGEERSPEYLGGEGPGGEGPGQGEDPGAGIDAPRQKYLARKKHFMRYYKSMSQDDIRRVIHLYKYEDNGFRMTGEAIAELEGILRIQNWKWLDECDRDDFIFTCANWMLLMELARYG